MRFKIISRCGALTTESEGGPGTYLVGRHEDCDICLEVPDVKPRHLRLILQEEGAAVEELEGDPDLHDTKECLPTMSSHPYPTSIQIGSGVLEIERLDADGGGKTASKITWHSDADIQPGKSIKPPEATEYRIGELISSGGMGHVFEATEDRLGRTIALKVIRSRGAQSQLARRRFEREARVLAHLEHPNIVPVHDHGQDESGQCFYTMKRINGRTLQEIITGLGSNSPNERTNLQLADLVNILRKACDAIAFAHCRGVIHRDLKPSNIMVGEFGEVLVMDWGLAKLTPVWNGGGSVDEIPPEPESESSGNGGSESMALPELTQPGEILGSPQYMAPEQATGCTEDIDERTDVFGLGAILYAILTLRAPVSGRTLQEVLTKVRSGQIDPPTQTGQSTTDANRGSDATTPPNGKLPHCPGGRIPRPLSAIAMKALAYDRDQRYGRVEELCEDLDSFSAGFATSVEQLSFLGHLALLIRRHQAVSTCIAIAAVVTVALIYQLVASREEARQHAADAGEQAIRANNEAARARQESERARTSEAAVKHRLYVADMRQVQKLITGRAITAAREVLDEHRDAPQRGWVWNYWDNQFPDYRYVIQAHDQRIRTVAVSNDGRWIATAGNDNLIHLWQADTMERVGTLKGHQASIAKAVFTSDSETIASVSNDGVVLLWDVGKRSVRKELPRLIKQALTVATSPDGRWIFVGGYGGGHLFSAINDDETIPLNQPDMECRKSHFSPDGRFLATGGKQVHIWEADTGRRLHTFDCPAATDIKFIDSERFVATTQKGRLQGWNFKTGEQIYNRSEIAGSPLALAISPSGEIFGGSEAFTLALRSSEDLSIQRHYSADETRLSSVAIDPQGQWLVFGNDDGTARIVDVGDNRTDSTIYANGDRVYLPSFSPNGEFVAVTTHDRVQVSKSDSGELVRSVPLGKFHSNPTCFAPDNTTLLVANDRVVVLWDITTGKELRRSEPHAKMVNDLAVSPNGTIAASCSASELRIWHPQTGKALIPPIRQNGFIYRLQFTPDSARLISINYAADRLDVWNAANGNHVSTIQTRHGRVRCLDLAPDGNTVATGGEDKRVRIWNLATGNVITELLGNEQPIYGLGFLGSDRQIATAAKDGVLQIWDTTLPAQLTAFTFDKIIIRGVTTSPDGRRILAYGDDKRPWMKMFDRGPLDGKSLK